MPNNYADWFVGGVSMVLGIVALWHAVAPGERTFELPKLRWIERSYGRNTARAVLGTLGAVLIGLGVAIATGWKVNLLEDRQSRRPMVSDNSSA